MLRVEYRYKFIKLPRTIFATFSWEQVSEAMFFSLFILQIISPFFDYVNIISIFNKPDSSMEETRIWISTEQPYFKKDGNLRFFAFKNSVILWRVMQGTLGILKVLDGRSIIAYYVLVLETVFTSEYIYLLLYLIL